MDVWGVFVGETTSYGSSVRGVPYYRDYEQFPYGTLEHNTNVCSKDSYSRVQEKCKQMKSEKAQKKECPFCKEHKKRPLINYMRKRHNDSICEEHEEEIEEAEEANTHNKEETRN